jgi:hypothetical protein
MMRVRTTATFISATVCSQDFLSAWGARLDARPTFSGYDRCSAGLTKSIFGVYIMQVAKARRIALAAVVSNTVPAIFNPTAFAAAATIASERPKGWDKVETSPEEFNIGDVYTIKLPKRVGMYRVRMIDRNKAGANIGQPALVQFQRLNKAMMPIKGKTFTALVADIRSNPNFYVKVVA